MAIVTGRKHFNISKNMESNEGVYYSQVYAMNRFSPDLPILPRSPDQSEKQVNELRKLLSEKDKKLKEMKKELEGPSETKANPSYHDIINASAYSSKQCQEIYQSHYRDLEWQMKEKQGKRIDEIIQRQKETNERLQSMLYLRDLDYKERKFNLEKAEEYRKDLEMQQTFEKHSKSLPPQRTPEPYHNVPYKPVRYLPKVSIVQAIPITKNQNRVAVDFSNFAAFQQPKYTKNSPKVTPSYPVIGTRPNTLLSRPEFKQAKDHFYGVN